ncbi:MAG: hypothetical protein ACI4OG_00965 [Bacilli bacterium]
MNVGKINPIEVLHTQEGIRILFIILNIFAFIADKTMEENLNDKNEESSNFANDVYIFITIINLVILIYYLWINYKYLSEAKENGKNEQAFKIKNLAYIVSMIALILFLYVQLTNRSETVEETSLY